MNSRQGLESLRKAQKIVKRMQEQEKEITRQLVLSGQKIVELGLVHNLQDKELQVQKAGIDFTLKRLSIFESAGTIDFDNTRRLLPKYKEVEFENDMVSLQPGAYLVEFNETVSLPLCIIGIMRTRSSVFRSGATLTAGIIDPGYSGAIGALLQVWNEDGISLSRNARLAQWVFAEIGNPPEEGYNGVYKNAKGMF